jgi:DNA polymerase-1
VIVIDFETLPITPTESWPEPVGVAIQHGDGKKEYVVGSHETMRKAIVSAMRRDPDGEIVMHNGVGFDLGVARRWLNLEIPINRVHDTMVLAFLDHPYGRHALKPLAEEILGMSPDEQQELRDWIRKRFPEATATNWGALIAYAPYRMVAPYAIGDVERTAKLFVELSRRVKADGMWDAYRREIRAVPLLLHNEMVGIRVNAPKLRADLKSYQRVLKRLDKEIAAALNIHVEGIDSGATLATALGIMFPSHVLPKTETGKPSTNIDALLGLPPSGIRTQLIYRSALLQDVRTFMIPWVAQLGERGERIYTHWNLVKGAGREGGGAKTGRLSSEPNFQNITSTEKRERLVEFLKAALGTAAERAQKKATMWSLPVMRDYIIAENAEHELIGRDYSQQELRLLAHYEGGDIRDIYEKFPDADLHNYVGEMIKAVTGRELPRKIVKLLNFCTIYGGGAPAVAQQGGMTLDEARAAREAYFSAMPSVKATMDKAQSDGKHTEGVRTIGGRLYPLEQGFDDAGRPREYAYRLLNYQIQGSAADILKEALGLLWARRKEWWSVAVFYLSAHDEVLFSCEKAHSERVLKLLDEIMLYAVRRLGVTVPFKTDGYRGETWAKVQKEAGL